MGAGGMSLSSAWKTAKWAANAVWKIKGLVNSEMLKHDVQEAGTIITTAGYYKPLTDVAVGDDDASRTGNSIYVRSVHIRGQLVYNGTAGATPGFCRLIVVIDTQQVGDTYPAISEVLDTATGGVNAHVLHTTAGRFKILYSRVFTTDNIDRTVVPILINLPMRHHARYNGTASTDIQRGGIYVHAISSEATNGPKLIYNARLSYHDN